MSKVPATIFALFFLLICLFLAGMAYKAYSDEAWERSQEELLGARHNRQQLIARSRRLADELGAQDLSEQPPEVKACVSRHLEAVQKSLDLCERYAFMNFRHLPLAIAKLEHVQTLLRTKEIAIDRNCSDLEYVLRYIDRLERLRVRLADGSALQNQDELAKILSDCDYVYVLARGEYIVNCKRYLVRHGSRLDRADELLDATRTSSSNSGSTDQTKSGTNTTTVAVLLVVAPPLLAFAVCFICSFVASCACWMPGAIVSGLGGFAATMALMVNFGDSPIFERFPTASGIGLVLSLAAVMASTFMGFLLAEHYDL